MSNKQIAEHPEAPETIKAVVAARAKARKAAIKGKPSLKAQRAAAYKALKGAGKAINGKAIAEVVAKGIATTKQAVAKAADNAIEIKPRGGKPISMRKGTTQAKFYMALLRPEGASADELEKLTGYTRSTLMSAIHGGRLKGKLKLMAAKLNITEDEKRGGKVYSIRAK